MIPIDFKITDFSLHLYVYYLIVAVYNWLDTKTEKGLAVLSIQVGVINSINVTVITRGGWQLGCTVQISFLHVISNLELTIFLTFEAHTVIPTRMQFYTCLMYHLPYHVIYFSTLHSYCATINTLQQ